MSTLVTLYRLLSASTVLYVHTLYTASSWITAASLWSDEYHVTSTGGLLGEARQVMLMNVPAIVSIVGPLSIVTRSAPTAIQTDPYLFIYLFTIEIV